MANLENRPQLLSIRGLDRGDAELFRLDSGNVASAKSAPEEFSRRPGQRIAVTEQELQLRLAPYGIARIDQGP